MTPADTGIVAHGVRRTFGDVVAVDSIDLEAPPGQVTALVGPNGSGKTTLLLTLAALLVPDSGTVSVAGFDPTVDPRAVRARTGWMPDVFGTWDALTCAEVLHTVSDAYRVPRPEQVERVRDLLELVHLVEFADRPTTVLSRGQKQRLGLARALVHDPSVLLLDEPASGLDPRSRIELRSIVRALAAQGRAVLVSSHVLAELDEMVDRAVVVAQGRTVAVETLTGPEAVADRRPRPWLVRSLDDARLLETLDRRRVPHGTPERDGVQVELAGDHDAAELLATLVRDGVPVVSLHPAAGVLEQVYLELTEDRR
ncbi:ABC transporter ATP-binding protein [Spongisporangium articulatum]|uniref:ABC transporter ATP-binding protein n=1 Tax=Spongisporangium articulatum TaxID=3362603 RepID=A0ABW8AJP8_9ACTN